MMVEYNDGTKSLMQAETETKLLQMLETEMKRPEFRSAQVFKGVELPNGIVDNRANHRKYEYTNSKKRPELR